MNLKVLLSKENTLEKVETDLRQYLPHNIVVLLLITLIFSALGKSDIASRSIVKQSDLLIRNVKPADAGSFTCKADGQDNQHTLVVVSGKQRKQEICVCK